MESNTKEKSGESLFFPSFSVLSVYALDFHRLYEKGYRALFLISITPWCITMSRRSSKP